MSKASHSKVLFLDFDGVLHPDAVFRTRKGPQLRGEGHLFMWVPLLAQALKDLPQVTVVLSTTWVRHLGFQRARSYLPEAIQDRVIGATWHSAMARNWTDQNWWDAASRYEQICRYAARASLTDWVAIDDDTAGWPLEALNRLVPCDGELGLSQPGCADLLQARLSGAPRS
ncbi:HAD domain-containing protein [Pseudomonas chengduensis]|nr:HAD domain-containing protein [Pseudomonas chengduensis]MDH1728195.1 HAD domain-containing protein [Pseudomonas chengduensis]